MIFIFRFISDEMVALTAIYFTETLEFLRKVGYWTEENSEYWAE